MARPLETEIIRLDMPTSLQLRNSNVLERLSFQIIIHLIMVPMVSHEIVNLRSLHH